MVEPQHPRAKLGSKTTLNKPSLETNRTIPSPQVLDSVGERGRVTGGAEEDIDPSAGPAHTNYREVIGVNGSCAAAGVPLALDELLQGEELFYGKTNMGKPVYSKIGLN